MGLRPPFIICSYLSAKESSVPPYPDQVQSSTKPVAERLSAICLRYSRRLLCGGKQSFSRFIILPQIPSYWDWKLLLIILPPPICMKVYFIRDDMLLSSCISPFYGSYPTYYKYCNLCEALCTTGTTLTDTKWSTQTACHQ